MPLARQLRNFLVLLLVGWATVFVGFQLYLHSEPDDPYYSYGHPVFAENDTRPVKVITNDSPPRSQAKPDISPPPPSVANCPKDCHAMIHTELPGDVVEWGSTNKKPNAAACCAACKSHPKGCNSWVFCANVSACGDRHKECWLKKRAFPFEDLDLLSGRSSLWTSGALGEAPPPPSPVKGIAAAETPCDLALNTIEGPIRLKLRSQQCPNAAKYVADLLAELQSKTSSSSSKGLTSSSPRSALKAEAPIVDPSRPTRDGLRFYRAEPVPDRWGSLDWPDNYFGGRWGPPYALLQGSLRPTGTRVRPSAPDSGPGAKPVIRRGYVAWAGGGGGPDFFIALAQHPEWGNGHTVWAEVLPGDMAVVDAIMRRPLRVSNWGSINATELVTPVPYTMVLGAKGESGL